MRRKGRLQRLMKKIEKNAWLRQYMGEHLCENSNKQASRYKNSVWLGSSTKKLRIPAICTTLPEPLMCRLIEPITIWLRSDLCAAVEHTAPPVELGLHRLFFYMHIVRSAEVGVKELYLGIWFWCVLFRMHDCVISTKPCVKFDFRLCGCGLAISMI
jgi:hypothetical protein